MIRNFMVFVLILTSAFVFTSCNDAVNADEFLADSSVAEQGVTMNDRIAQTATNVERVSPGDFETRLRGGGTAGVQLIDVRTPREYNAGHIEGAVLLDISKRDVFNNGIDALDKNRPVLVYCAVGGRSAAAAKLLADKGFPQIVDLNGGINAWVDAGKKTVK